MQTAYLITSGDLREEAILELDQAGCQDQGTELRTRWRNPSRGHGTSTGAEDHIQPTRHFVGEQARSQPAFVSTRSMGPERILPFASSHSLKGLTAMAYTHVQSGEFKDQWGGRIFGGPSLTVPFRRFSRFPCVTQQSCRSYP